MKKHNRNPFAEMYTDLCKTKTIEMNIDSGDHLPSKPKPYQTLFAK